MPPPTPPAPLELLGHECIAVQQQNLEKSLTTTKKNNAALADGFLVWHHVEGAVNASHHRG